MIIPNVEPHLTVDELIAELQDVSAKGFGACRLFVPCECGYSGAAIVKGWMVEDDIVTLFSDDM